ncbi:MAG TPA: hypothetical protein PLF22_07155 [Pseudomonadales bacterium]|nr:hypothetical protein [Pseudomonadales bacterium]
MKVFFHRYVLLMLLAVVVVGCSTQKPLQNITNSPIPAALTLKQVEKAIVAAGVIKGWQMKVVQPGVIEGSLTLRVHTARIRINYTNSVYNITYVDSTALDYSAEKNLIHRNYNNWITGLDRQIQAELGRSAL